MKKQRHWDNAWRLVSQSWGTIFLALVLLKPFDVLAQSRLVGKATDPSGQPLTGVSVVVQGTTSGTATDDVGQYALDNIEQGAILVFRMVGYKTLELQYTGQNQLDVVLEADASDLDEVIVVGYGTQRKVNLSGAVDQVDAKVLENRPISNTAQGLQGLVPNLNIRFDSGAPGAAADINIRGITSINGGGPLIMVDGVQVSSAELNLIAPQDIESISVIKDASAAAIYGARAAFGVILITTKNGSVAGTTVSYSNNLTFNTPTVMARKITDPYVFSRLLQTSTDNTPWNNVNYNDQFYTYARDRSNDPSIPGVRINPSATGEWEYMGNRDWARYFLDDFNFTTNHDLAISGMSENRKARYYLSGGYNRQNSPLTLADDYYDRFSLRTKVDYALTDWFTLGNNTSMTNAKRKTPTQLDIFEIYNFFPTAWDINPDGTWANTSVGRQAAAITDGGESTRATEAFQTQFTTELSFWDRLLRVNADYTYRRTNENYNAYKTSYLIGFGPDDVREEGDNEATREGLFDTYQALNIYGTLNKEIGEHHLSAILGYNQESYRGELFRVSRTGLISSAFPTLELATGQANGTERIDTYALRGAFFRLNYIFDNRYIVEFNGRYDGSSRFPKDKRFGFFPSGSVAWRLDQEPFMESIRGTVSNLKLRASYGSLGNQNVSNYGYIPSMATAQSDYLIGGARPNHISPPLLVSPNYTWEKVNTLNFGVDFGVMKEKLTATFDMYTRNTLNMLTLGKRLPGVLGAAEPLENAADLKTRGWELSLGYRDNYTVGGSPFNLEARFVLSDSKSEITRFTNPSNDILQYYEGMQLGEIWGLQSDGFFTNAEEIARLDQSSIIPWDALAIVPGWPKYKDLNGDNVINKGNLTLGDTGDLSVIGNTTPRYQFGLDLNMNWKNIDFRMFWQGVSKRDYYPLDYLYWGHYQQPYGNTFEHLLDFYRAENETEAERARHSQAYLDLGLADQNLNARFPHLQSWLADANLGTRIDGARGLAIPQTNYLLNAAYLRLKNLTIGYTLPARWTSKAGISRIRVFATGENVFEFSEVKKYFDPETTNANINTDPTQDIGRRGNGMTYPFQRSYSFGLNLIF
ncbi:TonB-linked outer membrane protein, SusC/RagA family [Parapedobacter luteus]|uniref:TonB-linked outer membrane protein, SusC/RagA family n=1 Tax=Parapedobacter luteus TaxID=623280 RepID=A0A1T4ZZ12_9SPHI|nr:TonB-dependent receptor [Parapedobacter luteus]SKB28024.1 TonB-linked outer membrane protein, SusC/RagA family [Parapedobacter luteus]